MAMNDTPSQTLLLDIYERLGGIQVSLKSIERLEAKLDKTEADQEEKFVKLDERVAVLEKFESRIGAYIWVGGSIVSGVLFFLFEGLKYLLPSKEAISKLFH